MVFGEWPFYANIPVKDLQEARRFYENTLGQPRCARKKITSNTKRVIPFSVSTPTRMPPEAPCTRSGASWSRI